MTFFALSPRRHRSARAGELHAVRGLEPSKARLLLTQLYVLVGNRLEKDAEAAIAGFVDSEIPSDQILFPSVQEQAWLLCKSCKTQVQWVGCCCCSWSLASSPLTGASQLDPSCLIIFSLCPIISSLFPLLLSQPWRQAVQIKRSALGRF